MLGEFIDIEIGFVISWKLCSHIILYGLVLCWCSLLVIFHQTINHKMKYIGTKPVELGIIGDKNY